MIQKIKETDWFLEKIDNIGKLLAKLSKQEKHKLIKLKV
jgi:hypothetical protein